MGGEPLQQSSIILTADLGGTALRFGMVDTAAWKLLFAEEHPAPATAAGFIALARQFLQQACQRIPSTIQTAVFAVAGPVQDQCVLLTTGHYTLCAKDLQRVLGVQSVLLVNDFQATAYAINVLKRKDLRVIRKGTPAKGIKACLGAGTGLGMSFTIPFQDHEQAFPSEGGHMNLPVFDEPEWALTRTIRTKRQHPIHRPQYQDLLSGKGLEDMYGFLQEHRYPTQHKRLTAEEITRTRNRNPCSKQALAWFRDIYARFCRNIALALLPRGGLYIAGGIAQKNPWLLDKAFIKEFNNFPLMQHQLQQIPITLILHEHATLLGAAYAYTRCNHADLS